jgi:hypothetical protein
MNLQGDLQGQLFTRDIPRDLHQFGRQVVDVHAKRAQVLAKEETPKLSGELARTTDLRKVVDGPDTFVREVVPTRPYAKFVHGGTGLFGPLQRRIVPKFKRALRWVAGGRVIFARSTAGQRPNPFLDRSFKRLLAESEALIDRLWRAF